MSAPPSPHLAHSNKKSHRPAALDIPEDERKAISDAEVRYTRDYSSQLYNQQSQNQQHQQFNVNITVPEDTSIDNEQPASRSASATSSLDPYYFGVQSESDSPTRAMPPPPPQYYLSTTPDHHIINEPMTPARNPAMIDRRGLVGVGELATPRWGARSDNAPYHEQPLPTDSELESYEVIVPEEIEQDLQDSSPTWTIEAIDGELSEKEELLDIKSPRTLRTRPSIADESGGEEILYPRNVTAPVSELPKFRPDTTHAEEDHVSRATGNTSILDANLSTSPPSAFNQSTRKARKRTSDEFEMDQTGSLVSKTTGTPLSKDKTKEEKSSVRKHRSLNVSTSSSTSKPKERRRESVGLAINSTNPRSPASIKSPERHVRQGSAGSVSSHAPDNHHARRVHTTDFSHLPPSPSSSSIQQFLRQTTGGAPPPPQSVLLHRPSKDSLQMQGSPNVAHSLLRGTQEGWSALNDDDAAEALRKLDGLSGRSARARASIGSLGRPSSSSRPGTPGKSGSQWEGMSASDSGKSKRGSGNMKEAANKERVDPNRSVTSDLLEGMEAGSGIAVSSDEQASGSAVLDKTPKKSSANARLSFTPKRGSTSSTTYTSTPSSRDSASMSAGTSVTSMSATSGRQSSSKGRRNSASSDISSVHSIDALKDRVASIAVNGEGNEEDNVPPVPPLPKDFSTYRSPPHTSSGLAFPTTSIPSDDYKDKVTTTDSQPIRNISLEVPTYTSPTVASPPASTYYHSSSANESSPAVPKTPSKKWSFSALNLKISGSPSSNSTGKSSFPLSPRSVTFGQQLRKSTSKDKSSSSSSKGPWSPNQPDAMASAGSLASLSSVGSVHTPAQVIVAAKTPDASQQSSRPGTSSSASTNHTTSALAPPPPPGPLSPSSSIRRSHTKRLTPSSIPFFRRSSSQSMQMPPPPTIPTASSSPPYGTMLSTGQTTVKSTSPAHDYSLASVSTPGTSHKKSSGLLGLPSLLKSTSRRSLHADAKDAAKEAQRAKDAAKESEKEKLKQEKLERERQKKEDKEKDRNESRISGIINRKRGKTLSSTDPRKPKSPVNLPPMSITAIEPVTAQRVAKLKASTSNSISSPASVSSRASTSSTSSRLTLQTISSLQKQSDTSLRSRNQLPTIAGSPSIATSGTSSTQTLKEGPPPSLMNSVSGLPKETPTKIPRISSRTSATASPPLKHSGSALATRRASGLAAPSANPSPTSISTNEFGVMDSEDGATPKVRQPSSVRTSPAGGVPTATSRVPRQSIISSTTTSTRKNRESMSFIGLRKSSTNSVTSLSAHVASSSDSAAPPATAPTTSSHRFSVLSPSKGLKLLGPKSSTRASTATVTQSGRTSGSPSSGRHSASTPSPAPSAIDEEELLGDEEMMHYIRRQHAKKVAAGASQEDLDEMLKFPEPIPPARPSSPATILKGSQATALSDYEKKEIWDYPNVYCIGARSRKRLQVLNDGTNNYGYDDERGDYLIVNHDHLAYRYEIMGTLGKGSFGQVLHCRDHCTGESVAVKIIRNKKRFHHQALVEIKILDNLRKWDAEEKHHVIKMTEHFYFRSHLCIATELLSINLYELIKANGFVGFTTALIRRFTSQMLGSLTLMRNHRIVHCDLKPENVLLRHPAKSAIKVIDFGSSCLEHEKIYTYIQSRFYRSPEVILGMNYHMAIDMWSLGCILAELYTGFPIFPGENEQEQLSCIMEVLGVPDKEFINRSSRRKLFFDTSGAPRAVVNSKGRRRRPGTKTLAQVLRCNDEEFVDFVAKCLVWDPERRIKPQAAMRHPFMTSGRKLRPQNSITNTPSSSTLNGRSSKVTETPKKSLISAPTPLTARTSRSTVNAPTTPSSSHAQALTSGSATTSRSYRTTTQNLSLSFNSSRTLSGYGSSTNK